MEILWRVLLQMILMVLGRAKFVKEHNGIFSLPDQTLDTYSSCVCKNPRIDVLNLQPVIGILSHPGDGASGRFNNNTTASYIAASYVKFVESAGARVMPLIYNEPIEILDKKMSLINGVIFTGGRIKVGLYYKVVKYIFEKVLERNKEEHFPLLAICLGFEILTMIINKDKNILEKFNARRRASTLQFIDSICMEGTVFERFSPGLIEKLSTDYIVMQNSMYGISPEHLQQNENLSKFFQILTSSLDRDNKVYVSTAQARNYPITALQWHPEKNAFEWGYSAIPHSDDAVLVTQHVANYLISEARKSSTRPSARNLLPHLIYNYIPSYSGMHGWGFDQVYVFPQHNS